MWPLNSLGVSRHTHLMGAKNPQSWSLTFGAFFLYGTGTEPHLGSNTHENFVYCHGRGSLFQNNTSSSIGLWVTPSQFKRVSCLLTQQLWEDSEQ